MPRQHVRWVHGPTLYEFAEKSSKTEIFLGWMPQAEIQPDIAPSCRPDLKSQVRAQGSVCFVCVSCVCEREGEKERERQRRRDRERQRQRDRDRETETERQRQRNKDIEKEERWREDEILEKIHTHACRCPGAYLLISFFRFSREQGLRATVKTTRIVRQGCVILVCVIESGETHLHCPSLSLPLWMQLPLKRAVGEEKFRREFALLQELGLKELDLERLALASIRATALAVKATAHVLCYSPTFPSLRFSYTSLSLSLSLSLSKI